jgi:hypothetical protein
VGSKNIWKTVFIPHLASTLELHIWLFLPERRPVVVPLPKSWMLERFSKPPEMDANRESWRDNICPLLFALCTNVPTADEAT